MISIVGPYCCFCMSQVNSAVKIFELLNLGNGRRKTESTEVNETSSRCVFSTFVY